VNTPDPVLSKERSQGSYRAPEVTILGQAIVAITSRASLKATGLAEFVTGGHVAPAYDLDE